MSKVVVVKIPDATLPSTLAADLEALGRAIRETAFGFYQSRGRQPGLDVEDWLRAERELPSWTESDLIEREKEFVAHVAAPGFEPENIQVTATPQAIIVRAETKHRHEETAGHVRYCEFTSRSLLRRIELPSPIDVDKVTATLDAGTLQVTAARAAEPVKKQVSAAAG
jgi:HSP20 family molecular chaperone IbpA